MNGHLAADCRRNPESSSYRGPPPTNPSGGRLSTTGNTGAAASARNGQASASQMHGFVLNHVETYRGQEQYCAICNSRDHHQWQCHDQERAILLHNSILTCRRCHSRGHTIDDCKHPSPEARTCESCHQSGHRTAHCTIGVQKKWKEIRRPSENRFYWHNVGGFRIKKNAGQLAADQLIERVNLLSQNGQMLTPEAKAHFERKVAQLQQLAWSRTPSAPVTPAAGGLSRALVLAPQITSAVSPAPEVLMSDVEDPQRLALIREKCEHSASLYAKENYTQRLYNGIGELFYHKVLPESTLKVLEARMELGCQFFRDPRAVRAIALKEKAECFACSAHGKFLDRYMNGVAGRDVLSIEDYPRWGVFVMFECSCSAGGYDYKA